METKVVHTLFDAVEAYRKQQREIEEENARQTEESRKQILEALADSGLSPLRIEERNLAVFDWCGQEIRLRIFKDRYWQVRREDGCKNCGKAIQSYDRTWTAENIGELVINPMWEYHNCPSNSEESTPEGALISALRDALGLNQYE